MEDNKMEMQDVMNDIQQLVESGALDMFIARVANVSERETQKNTKSMSEEQKKEAKELIENMFTQLAGAESYLHALVHLAAGKNNGGLITRCRENQRRITMMKNDFQIWMDWDCDMI